MNPFTTPDRLYISRRPQDMRAGIQRLASVVTTDFSMDPTDGALYCFVSRDCLLCSASNYPQPLHASTPRRSWAAQSGCETGDNKWLRDWG